jgi:hypothetical protein
VYKRKTKTVAKKHVDYERTWRRLRWMQLALLFFTFGFVPVFPRLGGILTKIFHDSAIQFLLFIVWSWAMVWTFESLVELHCPRCGRTFLKESWLSVRLFSRRCVHCGLPRNAKREEDEDR